MLNVNQLPIVKIFFHPEPTEPQPPATLDELIGVNIVFKHSNRFLYPDNYIGEVKDYRYCTSKEKPDGVLELLIKSPTFNIAKWITEGQFVCYEWELPTNLFHNAETPAFASAS